MLWFPVLLLLLLLVVLSLQIETDSHVVIVVLDRNLSGTPQHAGLGGVSADAESV